MKINPQQRNLLYALLAVVLLAIISVAYFYPDDMEGRVLQQHDISQGIANGQEGKAFTEKTGETTRWTNSLFSGMPNFQISPSYSSAPMLNWIADIYSLGLPSPANLLFILMTGFFIMGLCMKMRWYVALFGAIAWGFSTYFIIIIGAGHIWKFITLAYIPPTIGGIILCYRGKYLGGLALTALFGALQLLGNHIQMTYYFMMVEAAIVIGFLLTAIKRHELKKWCIATAAVLVGGALAFGANIASLYNTAQYTKETVRGKATEIVDPKATAEQSADQGAGFEYITQWSYGGDELLTFLVPNAKGGASIKPVGGENAPKDFTGVDCKAIDELDEQQTQVLQSNFREYFGNQPMTNGPVYVGAFLLFLAALGCVVWKGRMKWCLLAVTALTVLLALGHNFGWLTQLFIDYVPFYSRFRTVASILVVAEFTLPVFAMVALHKILTTDDFYTTHKRAFTLTGGIMLAVCLLLAIFPSLMGDGFSVMEREFIEENGLYQDAYFAQLLNAVKDARLGLVSADAWRSFWFLLIGLGFTWLYLTKRIKSKAAYVGAVTALILIDLFAINKRYVDSANFTAPQDNEEMFEMTDADRAILADTAMNYRVADLTRGLGDHRASFFHKSVGGYHAAKLTRYNDFLEHQLQKGNPTAFNMVNTKYIIAPTQDESGQTAISYQENPEAYGNAWWVSNIKYVDTPNAEMDALNDLDAYNNAVADKKFSATLGKATPKAPGDTIFETTYAPNRLTYHAKSAQGGIAVFSEVYFPWGWKATVDGKPTEIGRVDYILRAIRVPKGEHSIEFSFNPESLNVTNTISIVAVNLIYVACVAALVFVVVRAIRSRKATAKEEKRENNNDNQQA